MTRQNIYDDAEFFDGYKALRESGSGYNELVEQPAVRYLLPRVGGSEVVDLGCGGGQLAVELARRGARLVHAIDPSERMLASATRHPRVQYRRTFAEDVDLPTGSIDLVVASMSLHYVADLAQVLQRIGGWLRPGGSMVASMEHPVATSTGRWCELGSHRVVADYVHEGPRSTRWFVDGVIKYHRRLETIVAAITGAGLLISALLEPAASLRDIERQPALAHTRHCPPLLVFRADQPSSSDEGA